MNVNFLLTLLQNDRILSNLVETFENACNGEGDVCDRKILSTKGLNRKLAREAGICSSTETVQRYRAGATPANYTKLIESGSARQT